MRDSYTLYEDKLEGKYREAFQQIDTYFGTENVDEDTREEQMGELLDVFLLAQEEGKPLEKTIGKNLEGFCKSFCSNLSWQQKTLKVLDQLKTMAWFTFLFSVPVILFSLGDMIDGKTNIFTLKSDINIFGYILGFSIVFIVSAITSAITKKVMFKIKRISMIIWEIIIAVFAIVSFIIYLLLVFGNSTWDIPVWITALVSSMYLLLYYMLNKDRLKARKENKVSFWAEVKKDTEFVPNTDNVFSQEMEKKWEKKNAKRQKKGLPALTREEILALEEAEVIKSEGNTWAVWVFPIIVAAGFVIFGEFETPVDMYWFIGILLVVEYVLMALLWKGAKSGNVNIRNWIAYERKKLEQIDNVEEL